MEPIPLGGEAWDLYNRPTERALPTRVTIIHGVEGREVLIELMIGVHWVRVASMPVMLDREVPDHVNALARMADGETHIHNNRSTRRGYGDSVYVYYDTVEHAPAYRTDRYCCRGKYKKASR